jgi:hypothetical protein
MKVETNVSPTGTGQQGAGAPAGTKKDIPVHVEGGKPIDKEEHLANKAAKKGMERQQREDPTVFTK